MLDNWYYCVNKPQWRIRQPNQQWQWFKHDVWGKVAVQPYTGPQQILFHKLLSAMKMTQQTAETESPNLIVSHGPGPWGMWQSGEISWLHLYDLAELCDNTHYKKALWQMIQQHRLDGRSDG